VEEQEDLPEECHRRESTVGKGCDMSIGEMEEDRVSCLDLDTLSGGKEIRVSVRGKGIHAKCVCMMDRMKGSGKEFAVIVTESEIVTESMEGIGKEIERGKRCMIGKGTGGSRFVPVWIDKRAIQGRSSLVDTLRRLLPAHNHLTQDIRTFRFIRIRCSRNLSTSHHTCINIRIKDHTPDQVTSFHHPAFLRHRQASISNPPAEDDNLHSRRLVQEEECHRRGNDVIVTARENIWLQQLRLPNIGKGIGRGKGREGTQCTPHSRLKEIICVCCIGRETGRGKETEKGRGKEKCFIRTADLCTTFLLPNHTRNHTRIHFKHTIRFQTRGGNENTMPPSLHKQDNHQFLLDLQLASQELRHRITP
jgi:hypothetical protein